MIWYHRCPSQADCRVAEEWKERAWAKQIDPISSESRTDILCYHTLKLRYCCCRRAFRRLRAKYEKYFCAFRRGKYQSKLVGNRSTVPPVNAIKIETCSSHVLSLPFLCTNDLKKIPKDHIRDIIINCYYALCLAEPLCPNLSLHSTKTTDTMSWSMKLKLTVGNLIVLLTVA